ncbi:MAG: class I SAM-dependent methyltransferase, partial [Wohlfahrtiimonas sp.]
MPTHYLNQNQSYWDQQAAQNSPWSQPVSDELMLNAKNGNWDVHLMPSAIDKNWLGDIQGKKILCLASAGGQQAPILAAAGAIVTVLDISEGQLKKDQEIADKHQLTLTTVQGNMNDLSQFADGSFDLV